VKALSLKPANDVLLRALLQSIGVEQLHVYLVSRVGDIAVLSENKLKLMCRMNTNNFNSGKQYNFVVRRKTAVEFFEIVVT
jgi:hypothetical protein